MTPPPDDNSRATPGFDESETDPLKWLESLAARQGANPEEFITSADLDVPEVDPNTVIDEPGYTDYDPFGPGSSARQAGPAAAPEPAAARPDQTPTPVSGSPLDGSVDPLAWLESLARRQGANPEEFVTEADLEVPEVAADTVIDEPGYTPYDIRGTAAAPPPRKPVPAVPVEPVGLAEGELTPSEAAALMGLDTDQMAPITPDMLAEAAAPAAQPVVDPLSGAVDPLAWLESLARRQGARAEELITAADLEIPEPAADAVIDEPGYVAYSPFGAPEVEEEAAPTPVAPPPEPEPLLAEQVPSGGDTLAWLEDLAAEQGAAPVVSIDLLAGMSDEEIERRAAAGELTAQQMEAWLRRQAASLAAHRAEAEFAMGELEEVEPAMPTELPPWLQEAMPAEEVPVAGLGAEPPLVEAITEPPQPVGLPDWLAEEVPDTSDAALLELLGEAEVAAQPAAERELEEPLEPVAYEDAWAAALEEEYITQKMGAAEEEPEWYIQALQEPARGAALEAPAEEVAEAEALAPAEQGELPDWLISAAPAEVTGAAAGEGELPDWLTEPIPEATEEAVADWLGEPPAEAAPVAEAAPAQIPDWLAEPAAEAIEIPDWLAEAAWSHPRPHPPSQRLPLCPSGPPPR